MEAKNQTPGFSMKLERGYPSLMKKSGTREKNEKQRNLKDLVRSSSCSLSTSVFVSSLPVFRRLPDKNFKVPTRTVFFSIPKGKKISMIIYSWRPTFFSHYPSLCRPVLCGGIKPLKGYGSFFFDAFSF